MQAVGRKFIIMDLNYSPQACAKDPVFFKLCENKMCSAKLKLFENWCDQLGYFKTHWNWDCREKISEHFKKA